MQSLFPTCVLAVILAVILASVVSRSAAKGGEHQLKEAVLEALRELENEGQSLNRQPEARGSADDGLTKEDREIQDLVSALEELKQKKSKTDPKETAVKREEQVDTPSINKYELGDDLEERGGNNDNLDAALKEEEWYLEGMVVREMDDFLDEHDAEVEVERAFNEFIDQQVETDLQEKGLDSSVADPAESLRELLIKKILGELVKSQAKSIKDKLKENIWRGKLGGTPIDVVGYVDDAPVNDVQECNEALDLVLIMDRSNSIAIKDIKTVKNFFQQLVKSFKIGGASGTQVGVISYNKKVIPEFLMNKYEQKQDIVDAIGRIPAETGMNTRTDLALQMARDKYFTSPNGDRPKVKNVIILATDGRTIPKRFGKRTLKQAELAKKAGILIFILGLPNKHDRSGADEWSAVTSYPQGKFLYTLDRFEDLAKILPSVSEHVCDRLPPPPSVPQADPAPVPPKEEPACKGVLDVVFVIDRSTSIKLEDVKFIKQFYVDLTRKLMGNAPDTRIGALSYNNKVIVEFKLGQYDKMDQVIKAIEAIPEKTGKYTHTDVALRYAAMNKDFLGGDRDRPNVMNVIITATDGRTWKYGQSTPDSTLTIAIGAELKKKRKDIALIIVGLANWKNRNDGYDQEWKYLTSDDLIFDLQKSPYTKDSFKELLTRTGDIASMACSKAS